MKKTLFKIRSQVICLIMASALVLSGCSGQNSSDQAEQSVPQAAVTSGEEKNVNDASAVLQGGASDLALDPAPVSDNAPDAQITDAVDGSAQELPEEPAKEPSALPNDSTYTTSYDVPAGAYCYAETLADRALTAVAADDGKAALVSWRSFGDTDTEFTLLRNGAEIYRGTDTCFSDTFTDGAPDIASAVDTVRLQTGTGDYISSYPVYTLSYEYEGKQHTESTIAWPKEYQELELVLPADTKLPNNHMSRHTANDMSVGDLDGDGQLDLVVKWDPEDSQDNSKDGWTGTTVLDGYKLDLALGTAKLLWRIDLGINIRSGAHYTQYQVWDYNGDGRAEVMCKTADGTTTYDGDLNETGHVGAVSMSDLDSSLTFRKQEHDYRKTADGVGRVLSGPEYLTVFDGATGCIIDTVDYIPSRGEENAKGEADISSWGDKYGNRSDRFLAATAYIDEGTAAAVFARGYYGRTAITAWKLIDNKLTLAWYFDAPGISPYSAQGNHGLSVNDVDGDGLDELIYGSLCLDHDGSVLYCTGLGHGDAMHVSDWNGDGKLEVFQVHENGGADYQIELHDAETGEILWGVQTFKDTGRGMAADIDPRYPGAEMWAAANGNTFDCNGNVIYEGVRPSINFSIFWDGDLYMELFDYNNQDQYIPEVQKWDYENRRPEVLLSAVGTTTSNGTKGNAGLIADICGDWREEVILRCTEDPSHIRVYSTPIPTGYSVPCLLLDRAYREGVAWQNTAYNQPANLSVLLSK